MSANLKNPEILLALIMGGYLNPGNLARIRLLSRAHANAVSTALLLEESLKSPKPKKNNRNKKAPNAPKKPNRNGNYPNIQPRRLLF